LPMSTPVLEQLGVVTTRSGMLIVIDTGYLNLWSHDQRPVMPEGSLGTEAAIERANSFVDLRIVGSDAERAGRLLDMSWHPLYVYDQPPDHLELEGKLSELVRKSRLDARFEILPQRVPHRQRVELAIQQGTGAGEVQFHGVWAVAVDGVPKSQPVRVLGERSASYADRWKRVLIDCRPHAQVAKTEMVGLVAVDYARILIADVDALGVWRHEESLDGMADYVFWGRDAEQVASTVKAPQLESGEFGWIDVAEDTARERGLAVESYRDLHSLKLAGDYRPHSHHWRLMTPTRKSATESATMELAGTTMCNFMTTWGDGLFEVHRDLTESGDLAQIRVELERLPSNSTEPVRPN
jgi:hypothetical protein